MRNSKWKLMIFLLLMVMGSLTLTGCKGLDGLVGIIEATVEFVGKIIRQIDKVTGPVGDAIQTGKDVIKDIKDVVDGGQLPSPPQDPGPGTVIIKNPDDEDGGAAVPGGGAASPGGGATGPGGTISDPPTTGGGSAAPPPDAGTGPGGTPTGGPGTPTGTPTGTTTEAPGETKGWTTAKVKLHRALTNLSARIADVEKLLAAGLPDAFAQTLRKDVLLPLLTLKQSLAKLLETGDPASLQGITYVETKLNAAADLYSTTANVARIFANAVNTSSDLIKQAASMLKHWSLDLFSSETQVAIPPETPDETPEQKLRAELEKKYGIKLIDGADNEIKTASGNTYKGARSTFSLVRLQALKKFMERIPEKWRTAIRGLTLGTYASITKASAPNSTIYGVAFPTENQLWVAETSDADPYGWEGTLVHELTHKLQFAHRDVETKWQDTFWNGKRYPPPPPTTPAPTLYGNTQSIEDMAESVMAYYLKPEKLDPARRDFIKKYVFEE